MLQLLRLFKYFPSDSGLKGLYGPHSRQTLLGHSFGFVPHNVNLIILHMCEQHSIVETLALNA